MALVACKECSAQIYVGAALCPQCGVKNPGVSYEEERLLSEIQKARDEESYHADMYRKHLGGFLKEMINSKTINNHTDLANAAQERVKELERQLETHRQKRLS